MRGVVRVSWYVTGHETRNTFHVYSPRLPKYLRLMVTLSRILLANLGQLWDNQAVGI